ncbi:hypothetical protein RC88_05505 [Pectobacterium parvum]|nr:hypothetical protein RC88_05505 [Pectobacterium parvum]
MRYAFASGKPDIIAFLNLHALCFILFRRHPFTVFLKRFLLGIASRLLCNATDSDIKKFYAAFELHGQNV